MKVTLAAARTWVHDIFAGVGATPEAARAVAHALVAAEADGLAGHGLGRIPTYVAMLESGKIDGRAIPVIAARKAAAILVDAARGFAYPAIDLAVEELPAMARAGGIALAGITRSNHAGAVGLVVERLAAQGLIALVFANTPEAIAPWGGSKPVFGTNPIAFASPLDGRPPIVVDLALSKVARGNIVAAKAKGEAIPAGWALDRNGAPTTDPDAALAGTMVPMGDAKGSALALMVEVLAAALTGSHLAFEASSFLDAKGGAPETGQCIIGIDPMAFGNARFGATMARLAEAIEAQPGARLPGTRRLVARSRAERDGIAIAETLIGTFGKPR